MNNTEKWLAKSVEKISVKETEDSLVKFHFDYKIIASILRCCFANVPDLTPAFHLYESCYWIAEELYIDHPVYF